MTAQLREGQGLAAGSSGSTLGGVGIPDRIFGALRSALSAGVVRAVRLVEPYYTSVAGTRGASGGRRENGSSSSSGHSGIILHHDEGHWRGSTRSPLSSQPPPSWCMENDDNLLLASPPSAAEASLADGPLPSSAFGGGGGQGDSGGGRFDGGDDEMMGMGIGNLTATALSAPEGTGGPAGDDTTTGTPTSSSSNQRLLEAALAEPALSGALLRLLDDAKGPASGVLAPQQRQQRAGEDRARDLGLLYSALGPEAAAMFGDDLAVRLGTAAAGQQQQTAMRPPVFVGAPTLYASR